MMFTEDRGAVAVLVVYTAFTGFLAYRLVRWHFKTSGLPWNFRDAVFGTMLALIGPAFLPGMVIVLLQDRTKDEVRRLSDLEKILRMVRIHFPPDECTVRLDVTDEPKLLVEVATNTPFPDRFVARFDQMVQDFVIHCPSLLTSVTLTYKLDYPG